MQSQTPSRTIIVGCDGGEEADDAIALAKTLSGGADARLVLACVYRGGWSHPADRRHAVALRAAAEGTVALAEPGDEFEVERIAIASGSPAHGLHDLARDRAAALVVLGGSRHGRIGRVLPGSVAARLMHGSPCGIAVAPRGYALDAHPVRVIEVAYDDSGESDAALREATAIALAEGAALRIVGVADPAALGYGPALGSHSVTYANCISERLSERMRAVAEELPSSVRARTQVQRGNPGVQLVAEAEKGADLIVMGSRGYGPVGAVLHGSVSARVLEHAPCPVVVVPRGALVLESRAATAIATL
jgi:nucleotide-binding universal stress UspA family protein